MYSICFYACYFESATLPDYIAKQLQELTTYNQQVYVITNKKNICLASQEFLSTNHIKIIFTSNKGYDFGKYYYGFKHVNVDAADRIVLMNDSNILVAPLDSFFNWVENSGLDVAGILNSNERTPHLQSYFLVIHKQAIAATKAYFMQHKLFYLKRKVIRVYELGLSTFWTKHNFKIGSFIDVNTIEKNYPHNPSYFLLEILMQLKIPLIKRHVIMNSFGKQEAADLAKQHFKMDANYYLQMIAKYYSNK